MPVATDTLSQQGAPPKVIADNLRHASDAYFKLWELIERQPATDEDCRAVRGRAWTLATLLAYTSRLLDAGAEPGTDPVPSSIAKAVRDLHINYTLLASASTYDELLDLPLVPPEQITQELDDLSARRWMVAATL
jgi:hypothetical protein